MLKEKRKQDQLNHNIKNMFDVKVEELAPPPELGLINKQDNIDQNNIEFDNLLKVFENNYQNNPDYQYVRALE